MAIRRARAAPRIVRFAEMLATPAFSIVSLHLECKFLSTSKLFLSLTHQFCSSKVLLHPTPNNRHEWQWGSKTEHFQLKQTIVLLHMSLFLLPEVMAQATSEPVGHSCCPDVRPVMKHFKPKG